MTRRTVERRSAVAGCEKVATLAAGLRTVDAADPERLLRRALEALLEVGEADEAKFYRAVMGTDQPMTVRLVHVGSENVRRVFERFHAKPPLSVIRPIRSSAWDPARIKPFELGDFVETMLLHTEQEWFESQIMRDFFGPAGLIDQQRLLVAHGGQLAGWMGLFRSRGAPMFGLRDRQRLRPLVAPIAATVAAAARLDALGPGVPGDLVVRPDGTVEFASADAKRWLSFRGFTDALRARIRDLDRGVAPEPVFVLQAAEARALRLDGQGGVRYLVSVRPVRPIAIPSVVTDLTAAERDVAELAAAGASAADIARLRGTSVGTAKNQLKRIYRALGVSSRVELARVFESSSTVW